MDRTEKQILKGLGSREEGPSLPLFSGKGVNPDVIASRRFDADLAFILPVFWLLSLPCSASLLPRPTFSTDAEFSMFARTRGRIDFSFSRATPHRRGINSRLTLAALAIRIVDRFLLRSRGG